VKVILQEDVEGLGRAGQLVEVKDGYGRNYLIPKGLAVLATPRNVRALEHQKRLLAQRQERLRRQSTELAARINTMSATFVRKASDDDKLFGSVTSQNIVEFLASQGLPVERKQVVLEEPIKSLGVYTVPIKLHPEVTAELKVWVVKE
jgi:large subunit ribosomal protein L9